MTGVHLTPVTASENESKNEVVHKKFVEGKEVEYRGPTNGEYR